MMKRKEHDKGSLEAIPLDLNKKMTRSHHHQKEVYESSSRDNGVGSSLPLDLEEETLSRLPGKSLMRFQCVSKTWYSLIRSQRFVASYYAKKPSRFVVAFTNNVCSDPKRLFIMSGEEDETCSSSSLVANLDMKIRGVALPHGGYKFFSVHGFLACFEGPKFIICNPNTRQVISFHCKAPSTSLGYDPVDDQFKALTQATSIYDHMHNPSLMCTHEVIRIGRRAGRLVVSRSQVTSPTYRPMTVGRCINGFMYYGASVPTQTQVAPVFVCFDVRYERILPLFLQGSSFFDRFNLWILEDVTKHEWSKQTFELPFHLGMGHRTISQGTNKAGEVIFSPTTLQNPAQPFYVFYFNPVTKNTRRVRIRGVADTEDFWSRYGLTGICCSSFLPQHNDSIAFL